MTFCLLTNLHIAYEHVLSNSMARRLEYTGGELADIRIGPLTAGSMFLPCHVWPPSGEEAIKGMVAVQAWPLHLPSLFGCFALPGRHA